MHFTIDFDYLRSVDQPKRNPPDIFLRKYIMSDLDRYITKRKDASPTFASDFENGYETFKFEVLLEEALKEAGLTQADLAKRRVSQKSDIF